MTTFGYIPKKITRLIDDGALFVSNHSGGKDSQAMLIRLLAIVPEKQILIVHAHLPEVEWPGTIDHIKNNISDLPLIICRSVKTFFQMVNHRKMWPSPDKRQCTSDLKRGPIEREVRRYLEMHPEFRGKIVNCLGIRAEESARRSKNKSLKFSKRNSAAGREWWEWLPIFKMLKPKVFATITAAGQKPHWAYSEGMSRLSCCFCIMSNRSDLCIAAKLRPELLKRYIKLEHKIDHTFIQPVKGKRLFLADVIAAAQASKKTVQ